MQLNGQFADAYYLMSKVYREAKEEEKAQTAVARALAIDPDVEKNMENKVPR